MTIGFSTRFVLCLSLQLLLLLTRPHTLFCSVRRGSLPCGVLGAYVLASGSPCKHEENHTNIPRVSAGKAYRPVAASLPADDAPLEEHHDKHTSSVLATSSVQEYETASQCRKGPQ